MQTLSNFIKENLLSSFNVDKTISILSKLDFIKSCKNITNNKYSTIKLEIDNKKYVHSKFESVLNICNYFVSNFNMDNDNTMIVIIKPRITECVTEFVYNQRYIYHLTTKENWKSICRDNGLRPKNAKYEFRPKQTFLFVRKAECTLENLKNISRIISKFSKNKDILLEIDLNYIDNKINFYIDPAFSSNEVLALYTRDFIPKLNKESFKKYEI